MKPPRRWPKLAGACGSGSVRRPHHINRTGERNDRFLFLYNAARTANKLRKKYKKERAGKRLSPVRRIEFVHPVPGQRVVSMTFDDGLMAMGCNPPKGGKGLTEYLLGVMAKYGARGTFDVVGSTADNYPDTEGALGSFNWDGCKSDHYPMFGWDKLAGAIDCPQLIRAILDEGHEISNHSCTHHLFGPMNLVYRQRRSFETIDQVVGDLRRLHDHLQQEFGYTMRLSRPTHYIDAIPDGFNAYDAINSWGIRIWRRGSTAAGGRPAAATIKGAWMRWCAHWSRCPVRIPTVSTARSSPEGRLQYVQADACGRRAGAAARAAAAIRVSRGPSRHL